MILSDYPEFFKCFKKIQLTYLVNLDLPYQEGLASWWEKKRETSSLGHFI